MAYTNSAASENFNFIDTIFITCLYCFLKRRPIDNFDLIKSIKNKYIKINFDKKKHLIAAIQ